MKVKHIIYIIIAILVVGILYNILKEDNVYNKIDLPADYTVINRTPWKYADTVVILGLSKLKITPRVVVIRELIDKVPSRDRITVDNTPAELQAYIYGNQEDFVIFLKHFSRTQIIPILSHELIHIKQLYEGTLSSTEDGVVYENTFYSIDSIPPYQERPWELDAEREGRELGKYLSNILYEKVGN